MTGIVAMLDGRNWTAIAHELDVEGYALLPGLLTPAQARELANAAPATAPTARASADNGELFGHAPTAPAAWMPWREAFYRHLAPIANRWQQILDDPLRYPAELPEFLARNRAAGQTRPLSRLQRLRQGDEVGLHQHVDGDCVFPLQVVALLSEPGRDFTGGEFVMTEQRPRMQSRPIVLPLGIGDAAIIGAGQRPFRGSAGYYRVNLKHAISRVRDGERVGLDLLLHDAP